MSRSIACIDYRNGKIFIAKRQQVGDMGGRWEFPGGKVEKGETDQQALAREIKEELDIDVEVEELIDENYNEYSDKNINLKVYKCRYVSGEIKNKVNNLLRNKYLFFSRFFY